MKEYITTRSMRVEANKKIRGIGETEMNYLMGIDNGGTFSKAAIFDEDGHQISVASFPRRNPGIRNGTWRNCGR